MHGKCYLWEKEGVGSGNKRQTMTWIGESEKEMLLSHTMVRRTQILVPLMAELSSTM